MPSLLPHQSMDAQNVPGDRCVHGPKNATQTASLRRRCGLMAAMDPVMLSVFASTLCPHRGVAAPPPR